MEKATVSPKASPSGNGLEIRQLDEYRWLIPRQGKMRVDGLIYASDKLMQVLRDEQALTQVANVAHLPGILRFSYGMPDIHWGYGFPIGGVAAPDRDEGVISPGGVGSYDRFTGSRTHQSTFTWSHSRSHANAMAMHSVAE